jgi:flagellar biosynthesis/type III secretory pathway M-ring protein FliF/YscJ
MNWDQVESESETYTPGSPDGVLRSSREITEVTTSADGTVAGLPGTGSNIPDTAPSFQTEITDAAGAVIAAPILPAILRSPALPKKLSRPAGRLSACPSR